MLTTRLYTILSVSFFYLVTAGPLTAQMITHVPLYTLNGESAFDFFGGSVSGAGDVNGDGTPDLIVGARGDDNNILGSGSARVFSGSDGSVLHTFNGISAGDIFGSSVSGAGDVNGDGTPDLIVGAIGDDPNGSGSGSARVLSGSDGSVLHTFDGDGTFDRFGVSVSGAGDIDGDGRADLFVGASSGGANGGGYARVLSGRDGSVLYNFDGEGRGGFFGRSVSGAGDVNGDGIPDLIVGAIRAFTSIGNGGTVRVFSGGDGSVLHIFDGDKSFDGFGASVSGAGDVDGDGRADLIVGAINDDPNGNDSGSARVLSGRDGSILYNFNGDGSGDEFGNSVSCAGDVNGDGRADLIVGAALDDHNGPSSGSVRVLSGVDGRVLYNFNGDGSGDEFGESVSDAGDINGDGIDDFIVGAQFGGANDGGYARVFVSQVLGDCNQDGAVNFLDIGPFIAIVSSNDFLGQADVNEDGMVNFLDIGPFIALLSS